jgi:hypothetical protein
MTGIKSEGRVESKLTPTNNCAGERVKAYGNKNISIRHRVFFLSVFRETIVSNSLNEN